METPYYARLCPTCNQNLKRIVCRPNDSDGNPNPNGGRAFWVCPNNPKCKVQGGEKNFFWEDGGESLKPKTPPPGPESAPKRVAVSDNTEVLLALNNLRGEVAELKVLITANLAPSDPQPMPQGPYVPKFGQH